MCSGTHPFAHWHAQDVSPSDRYEELIDKIQWPARRLAIHGIHFHVGVRSGEKAIAITNCAGVPPARSSWRCRRRARSGTASTPGWRRAAPRCSRGCRPPGLPPQLDGVGRLRVVHGDADRGARRSQSIREVWWDVRPHPDFGTVELRMCDGMASLGEVAAVAALAQCLVHDLRRRLDRGEPLPGARDWVVAREQVAGRPLRARRADDRRRPGHAAARSATSSPSS